MDFTIIKANLEKLGYTVNCFENKEQATEYLVNAIQNTSVGFGGSMTSEELGLYEKLAEKNEVYWHWKATEELSPQQARTLARDAKVYISSVNGAAKTGELINIDGNGNRVAEIMYGHEKVYLIIGENKIEDDYEKALFRAGNIAAPLNAQRLNKKTPCAIKADKCYNCKSPDRICCGLSVLWKSPAACEYEVILVNEKLGY